MKPKEIFPESRLAHKYLDGLAGLEIGASFHNPFGLKTKNVDFTDSSETVFKREEIGKTGEYVKVDIVASGDEIPVSDESKDFVVSSHVLEHFPDPIKALKEWHRVIRPGGYIFMIIPHKDRTFDRRNRSTRPEELQARHETKIFPEPKSNHFSFWTTLDMLDLIQSIDLEWRIIDFQDVDDKVGNGFSIVIKKEKADPEKDKLLISKIAEFKEKIKKENRSLVNILKIKRVNEILKNSGKEFRKNGLAGVLRRMKYMYKWDRE